MLYFRVLIVVAAVFLVPTVDVEVLGAAKRPPLALSSKVGGSLKLGSSLTYKLSLTLVLVVFFVVLPRPTRVDFGLMVLFCEMSTLAAETLKLWVSSSGFLVGLKPCSSNFD